jgi:hypothetical protein
MPLGLLAKDSMVNLAELASKMDDETDATSSVTLLSDAFPGDETLVRVVVNDGDDDDDEEEERPAKEVEETGELPPDPGTEGGHIKSNNIDHEDGGETDDSHQYLEKQGPLSVGSEKSGSTAGDFNGMISPAASNGDDKSSASSAGSVDSDAKIVASGKVHGQYTGFSADYHDFENYAYSSYNFGSEHGSLVSFNSAPYPGQEPWWCCLFPWATKDKMIEDDYTLDQEDDADVLIVGEESAEKIQINGSGNLSRASSKEDDEISTGSDMFGEKLSDKDRQAVLARLRLAQPDTANPQQPSGINSTDVGDASGGKQNERGLLTATSKDTNKKTPRRSILRRSSTVTNHKNLDRMDPSTKKNEANGKTRRSLFPTYENKAESSKKDLHTSFAPLARVVTIKSLKDMDDQEKSRVWWQKPDYEEFRRTGRMITKAMLEGGSEIWLATNQSWQMPNQGKAQTLQHAYSLADRQAAFQKGDLKAKQEYEDTRDKWWHKFGHSRRGLEHIASIDEGRQRQANVKTSIRAVLEEQRRQKVFHREDPEKLRMVSIQNTSWARDLALAAGASDADAVNKNFNDESRRSREFYLLKFSRANQTNNVPSTVKKIVPAFMKPMMTMQIQPNLLDANTTSQIRYRQQSHKQSETGSSHKRSTSALPDTASLLVPVNGEDEAPSHDRMAKKGR